MSKQQNQDSQTPVTQADKLAAAEHYERGRQLWAAGQHGAAMTEYNHAVALDPQSPAATALKMATEIMDFFDPAQLNP